MRVASSALFFALATSFGASASAQTVDLGRGELPLHVPAGYDANSPAPLVVLLHGYGASGERQNSYMKFSELVDSHGFLLIAPDGTREESERSPRFWNASQACCNFRGSTVDDSGYIVRIIDEIKSRYAIDDDRVYLIGHSNGGFMSYRVAYEHSSTIAAIASLAGAGSSEDRGPPPNPVHVLQIHGTADETIEYGGGDIGGARYPSAEQSVERWARYNGCSMEGVVAGPLDLDGELTGAETIVTRYETGCRDGGSSELWTIREGSHRPALSDSFAAAVIEWLLAHPKG